MQHRLRWPRRLPHFGLASAASELSHFYQESSGAYLYASMPVRGKGDGGWRRGLQCSYPFRRRGNETPYDRFATERLRYSLEARRCNSTAP
jgi:hypothetical protein